MTTLELTTNLPVSKTLRVDDLIVDPEVQRALDSVKADKIAKNLRLAGIGSLVVSHRPDGTNHVIDGQHRRAALRSAGLGDNLINCLVYENLTRAEEAAMFLLLNDRTSVTPIDKFRIKVIRGDVDACDINKILAGSGWYVGASKSRGRVWAIGAVESLYARARERGPEILTLLLKTVGEAWDYDGDSLRSEIVSGLGGVLLRHESETDIPKLVHELSEFGGPRLLIGKAKALRDMKGGTVADAMAEILIVAHNKKKQSRRLPNWQRT